MNLERLGTLGRFLVMVAVVVFPFSVYFLIETLGVEWLGGILLFLLAVRLFPFIRRYRWAPVIFGIVGVAFLAALAWTENVLILQFYPTFVNLGLLSAFGATLIYPPTMVQRFAMAAGMAVNRRSIAYTRAVTVLWCVFFALNAAVSGIITIEGSMRTWTIYNGFLSYLIVGIIFAAEYLFRQFYMRRPYFQNDA
jgi:uncharacterized membrane protein